jgi:hypothetical protein
MLTEDRDMGLTEDRGLTKDMDSGLTEVRATRAEKQVFSGQSNKY